MHWCTLLAIRLPCHIGKVIPVQWVIRTRKYVLGKTVLLWPTLTWSVAQSGSMRTFATWLFACNFRPLTGLPSSVTCCSFVPEVEEKGKIYVGNHVYSENLKTTVGSKIDIRDSSTSPWVKKLLTDFFNVDKSRTSIFQSKDSFQVSTTYVICTTYFPKEKRTTVGNKSNYLGRSTLGKLF